MCRRSNLLNVLEEHENRVSDSGIMSAMAMLHKLRFRHALCIQWIPRMDTSKFNELHVGVNVSARRGCP
jgi:hypothetical protein